MEVSLSVPQDAKKTNENIANGITDVNNFRNCLIINNIGLFLRIHVLNGKPAGDVPQDKMSLNSYLTGIFG